MGHEGEVEFGERTAVEPAEPQAINMERDELVFYPLIYWPVLPDAPELSAETAKKLDTYMKNGGMVLLDTRDANIALPGQTTPATEALRRILARIISRIRFRWISMPLNNSCPILALIRWCWHRRIQDCRSLAAAYRSRLSSGLRECSGTCSLPAHRRKSTRRCSG